MGTLRILSASGDLPVTWDINAKDAIAEAQRIFEETTARGASAFSIAPVTKETRRMQEFDPDTENIVIVPRMIGG
jgi:hypothetical protein